VNDGKWKMANGKWKRRLPLPPFAICHFPFSIT
jgi:hypothetical protein